MEVAWDDDTRDRWILWWFRYDPERRERRNTVVAAFTRRREFERRLAQMSRELERRQAAGESEAVEHLSGVLHEAGYRAKVRGRREGRGDNVLRAQRRT